MEICVLIMVSSNQRVYKIDGNRDIVAETEGGVVAILKCLNSSNVTIMTTCCAVLLNLTMENGMLYNPCILNLERCHPKNHC